ncbi:MAG TPA: cytochrome b/b6 domain-containing protein [Rhodanobacteraceae bacterium]
MPSLSQSYRPAQRYLHWIIFVLVLAAYVLINVHHWTPRGVFWHGFSEHLHMVVGTLVLLLVLPRLWLRGKYGAPPIEPPMARLARWSARVTHWALYAFLLLQPLLGLAYRQLEGKSVSLLGVTLIPSFVSHPDKALAKELFFQYHALLGTVFYWIIGLHIAAALWHHFARRDNTLKRMWGARRADGE